VRRCPALPWPSSAEPQLAVARVPRYPLTHMRVRARPPVPPAPSNDWAQTQSTAGMLPDNSSLLANPNLVGAWPGTCVTAAAARLPSGIVPSPFSHEAERTVLRRSVPAMAATEEPAVRKRKRKQERDPRQPPRPPTAYILFNSARRTAVIEEHAKAEQDKQKDNPGAAASIYTPLTMVEATKVLAQQWRDVCSLAPTSPCAPAHWLSVPHVLLHRRLRRRSSRSTTKLRSCALSIW
jgi:hypothetical protein